jgi:tetratricopeptide (TPR) repeat protein
VRRSPRAIAFLMLHACVSAGLLGGCVYYNGMYNANRLAKSARQAERDGRTFEATSLWGQVATKAESVVVRHPRSKYAEEAAILRGLALARLGQCEQAMSPLGRVAVARVGKDLTEDAWLATGRCHLAMGNVPAADAAFAQVLDSKNTDRRREARYHRARSLRRAGRYEEALSALNGISDPRSQSELLLALAGAGRASEAMAIADSLIARNDTTQPWDSMLVSLGAQDPSTASALVDRLQRLPKRPADMQARWLLEDGLRLLATDTARAAARFREAIGGSGQVSGRASLELVRLNLRAVSHPQALSPVIQTLRDLAKRYEYLAPDLTQLETSAAGILAAAASVMPGVPQGDLRLFLAAEAARDTLQAPRLAEGIFLRILNQWPESPYAPKAVLAAQRLNPAWADSARTLLESRYLDSPYLAMIRGEDASGYRQLEDSLSAFAAASAPPVRRTRPGVPGRPVRPADRDADDQTPGRQKPPARGVEQ